MRSFVDTQLLEAARAGARVEVDGEVFYLGGDTGRR